jgi:SAM-dependent methyltransferase
MFDKKAGARVITLIALQGVFAGLAWPQESAQPQLREEFAKQEKIYRSQGASVPRNYVTNRSLASYEALLPSGFGAALRKLGPSSRWMDIGAGGGQAILDYYALERPRGKARAVALSIEDRRTDLWHQRAASLGENRIRYLHGKRLREYSGAELGKFQIITDVYGGFSYTENLSLFLERVLEALAVNGGFYTMVQSVHLQDGRDNPKTWYLTEIVDPAGRDVNVCSWLRTVSCVKVTCESKSDWDAPTELIHVRKVCNAVKIPQLKALQYEAGIPPGRKFRLGP